MEVRLSDRAARMLERITAALESILGRTPRPDEVAELALERLLQELDSRHEYVWY